MKSVFKFRWWKLLVLLVIIAAGASAYLLNPFDPDARAREAMKGNSRVEVLNARKWIQFSSKQTEQGLPIIFYPGALVEPGSYAPLASQLAENGHSVYVVKMPLDLAIFGSDRGNLLLEKLPDTSFIMGGHSLGGVMASRFVHKHQDRIKGIFYLASYPDSKGSLSSSSLSALSILGTKDGIVNQEAWEAAKPNLPAATTFISIEGGNHEQFSSYGHQKGDLPADISAEDQLLMTTHAIEEWLKTIP